MRMALLDLTEKRPNLCPKSENFSLYLGQGPLKGLEHSGVTQGIWLYALEVKEFGNTAVI